MGQEVRIDGSGRALLCTILFSAWVLQQKTEAGGCRWYTATTTVLMQVLYRRFPIRTSGNRGTLSAPVSPRISSRFAPECTRPQRVPWHSISLAVGSRSPEAAQMAASLAGNSSKSARPPAIAGSACRVTTALRSGSDAASEQHIGCDGRYLTLQTASD